MHMLNVQVTGADAISGTVGFDVIQETLRATNLGQLTAGSAVNFERLALGSPVLTLDFSVAAVAGPGHVVSVSS